MYLITLIIILLPPVYLNIDHKTLVFYVEMHDMYMFSVDTNS